MLRDYLKLDADDQLQQQVTHVKNRGQDQISEWLIVGKDGERKGLVSLFDKMSTRRSYPVNYRITQTDMGGKVIVDKLTETI